ncbi:MAG TPA: hypothetical protein VLL52_03540 [Anaerolineae bacterium]|nr:hypothetical protein [Anaerolineae bacterium]
MMSVSLFERLQTILPQPPTHLIVDQPLFWGEKWPKAQVLGSVESLADGDEPVLLLYQARRPPRPRVLWSLFTDCLPPSVSLCVVVPIVPGTHRRGKKGDRVRAAGGYVNSLFRFHDDQHQNWFSANQWQYDGQQAGWAVAATYYESSRYDFYEWVAERPLASQDVTRLQALLLQAPKLAAEFLTPDQSGVKISFRLTDVIIVAHRI